jgi:ubiquinone/menaquinone biosynthesis C-methylase UbiE
MAPRQPTLDQWAAWLLQHRQGGSDLPDNARRYLHAMRDRVLDGAALHPSDIVLDVGCGDGLIGFGALERLGPGGRVVFTDVSTALLKRCQEIATGLGVTERCDFLQASAEDLSPIPDASVDAVTTRSVLIYVADKPRALREFLRVLRVTGRISLSEPINRFTWPEPEGYFYGYDLRSVGDLLAKVRGVYERLETEQSSMFDFDERDLLRWVEEAGFTEIHLDYRVDIEPREPDDPDRFLRTSGNPLIPTLQQAAEQALTSDERERFVTALGPLVAQGRGTHRLAAASLAARKS